MVKQYAYTEIEPSSDSLDSDVAPSAEQGSVVNIEAYRQRTIQRVGAFSVEHSEMTVQLEKKSPRIDCPYDKNMRFRVMDQIRREKIAQTLQDFNMYRAWAEAQPPQPKNYDP